MSQLTQKISTQFPGTAIRVVILTLLLVVFASAAIAQTKGYVTNAFDDSVSVIDTATNTVSATIPVGSGPQGVAATPNGAFVYVANGFGNSVSVISTATDSVVATVPVGTNPELLAITPNGSFVYVVNRFSNSVSVIATATNTVVATVPVTFPHGIAITRNGAFAYVTSEVAGGNVSVIDTTTNTVVATIPVPFDVAPFFIAIAPDGTFAYTVTSNIIGQAYLSKIDTASNSLTAATEPVFGFISTLDFTPTGNFAYVTNFFSDSVSVLDTATNTVSTTVPVGSFPIGVTVRPDGAFAYVANQDSNNVSVVNTTTNTVTATIPVGNGPQFIAFAKPLTPQDQLAALIDQVEALIAGGTLTQNQGSGLIDKLNQVVTKLNNNQTGAACNQLSSFNSQVSAFINSRVLTQAQGQALIDAVNAIKTNLGC